MGARTPTIHEIKPDEAGTQIKMNWSAWSWGLFVALLVHVDGKLHINRLDQLETNLISNEAASAPSPSRVINERDWVKLAVAPPVIINTRLGERVEIECEVIGSPTPEIQWLRGERSVTHRTQSRQSNTVKGTGLWKMKSRLVIDCATRKHEGFYTCAATSGAKTIKAEPTLVLIEGIGPGDLELCSSGIRQPPRIVTWTPTAMLTQGADLQLPCAALGTPAPSIYWIDPQNTILNSVRHQVSTTGELTISNLAWSDMGEYTCVAQSSEGRDEVTTFVYPVMNEP